MAPGKGFEPLWAIEPTGLPAKLIAKIFRWLFITFHINDRVGLLYYCDQ